MIQWLRWLWRRYRRARIYTIEAVHVALAVARRRGGVK